MCLNPLKPHKGSPILKHLKTTIPIMKEKFMLILRNGRKMRIQKDGIYEMNNLLSGEDLAIVKAQMNNRNLQILYDILEWINL